MARLFLRTHFLRGFRHYLLIHPVIPTQASPVIPAKAGIHNGAPIMKQPAVYIMTNKAKGTLYTGVTNNLKKRVWEHRENQVEGFTQRYAILQLVY